MANHDETNMFEEFAEALEIAASSDVPPPSSVPNTSPPLTLFTSNAISTTHTNDCKDCREDRYLGNNQSNVNYSKEIKDSDVVTEEELQKIKLNNKLLSSKVLIPWKIGKKEDMPQRKPKYPTETTKQKKRKKEQQKEKGKKKTSTTNESADDKVHPLIGVPLGIDEGTRLPLVDPHIILMGVKVPNVKKWTSDGRDKFHRVIVDNQEEFTEEEQEHALSTIKIINDCEALGLTFLSAKKSSGGQWVYCETSPKNDDYTGKRADRGCLQQLVYAAVYKFWTGPGYKTVLNNVKEDRRQKKESLNEIQSLLGRVDELRLGNPNYKSESLRAEKIDRVKEYKQYCLEVNTAREEQKKIDAGVKVEVSILLFIEYPRTYTHIVIYRIVIYRT